MQNRAGREPQEAAIGRLNKPTGFARAVILLAIGAAFLAVPAARGAVEVDLGNRGVTYTATVIPPSEMNASYLVDSVLFYNKGNPTSVTLGTGKNQATYAFTKKEGSLTPAAPNLPAPTTINSEISSFTDKGMPAAIINLGTGGFEYLIGQWDGPNGADTVYYIGGLSGLITLNNLNPQFGPGGGYGLSGFWLGGGNNLPPNPNQNIVPVPEPVFGMASLLMALPLSSWIFLRRR